MVFLTMTSTMVEALEKIQALEQAAESSVAEDDGSSSTTDNESNNDGAQKETIHIAESSATSQQDRVVKFGGGASPAEPSLHNPKVGNPISHGQAIDLSKQLKAQDITPNSLDTLLRGARVYIAPPPPKPEPTPEYKALMVRLRREEEERSYDRMTNPPPPMESFRHQFPASSAAHAFDSNHYPTAPNDPFAEKDEVEYADIDRQIGLIFNVMISVFACAGAIWVVARWWNTPARLALSMSGSILVGVAEVVVYSGYVRRVGESKGKEKAVKEVKEVMKTWVIGGEKDVGGEGGKSTKIEAKQAVENGTRKRRTIPS